MRDVVHSKFRHLEIQDGCDSENGQYVYQIEALDKQNICHEHLYDLVQYRC